MRSNRSVCKTKMPEYIAWRNAKRRCENPMEAAYKNYGGRGIEMCARWRESFWNFYEDMGPRPACMDSLDRIDVDGDYEPENCRWATWHTQHNNKRANVRLSHNGETRTLAEWAEHLSMDASTLWRRLKVYNIPVDRALNPKTLRRPWRHGTRHGYETGCRCQKCKAAHADRHRTMRARRRARAEEVADAS